MADGVEVSFNNREIEDLLKRLGKVLNRVDDRKEKRKVLRKGAKPVVKAARSITPESSEEHFRYNTPKAFRKSKRAAKGSGVVVGIYRPGNLALSIRSLLFRRSEDVYVGPNIRKKASAKGIEYGPGTGRTDAYYAQMIYGSAKAFQERITARALQMAQGAAVVVIRKELERLIGAEAVRQKLK